MEFSEGGNKGRRDRSANVWVLVMTQCYPESSTPGSVFGMGIWVLSVRPRSWWFCFWISQTVGSSCVLSSNMGMEHQLDGFLPWRGGGLQVAACWCPEPATKASLLSGGDTYRGCVGLCGRSNGPQNQFQWWQCSCCPPGGSRPPMGQPRPGSALDQCCTTCLLFLSVPLFLCIFFFQQSHCRFDLIFLLNWQGFNYPPE